MKMTSQKHTKFAKNAHQNSADAIEDILSIHFPVGSILDVNYSMGTFYKNVSRDVIGIDIRPVANILADNKNVPFSNDSFDLGVCDPPYKRGNGETKYSNRYGAAPCTARKSSKQYFDLLPELIRVSRDGIIIKGQDETDGHRFYSRMFEIMNFMKELTGMEPHDVSYVIRSGVVDNNIGAGKNGSRHFMANCVSFFLVYKWKSKYPFKPVRFYGAK